MSRQYWDEDRQEMVTDLTPGDTDQRDVEALCDMIRRWSADGFTGDVVIRFEEGAPDHYKKQHFHRFKKKGH